MVLNQAYLFLIFIINGFIIGLIFDIFRILRKSFKTSDFLTYIEDILFWIITGIIVLYSIFIFNNGEIRFFMFIGILLGAILYLLLISKYVIKISVKTIQEIKKAINFIIKIIILPFKIIYKGVKKVFAKPILFCIINIKKIIRQITIKFSGNNKKIYTKKTKNIKKVKN